MTANLKTQHDVYTWMKPDDNSKEGAGKLAIAQQIIKSKPLQAIAM